MNTIIKPAGPHDSSVYWRRRVFVVVVFLVLLFSLVFLVRSVFFSAKPTVSGGVVVVPSVSPSVSVSAQLSRCVGSSLRLEALADQVSYPVGVSPVLTLSLTNVGGSDCLVNVGTSQQEFLIFSGSDRIWSSRDCQIDPVDNDLTIGVGETKRANVTWNLLRSDVGCVSGLPVAVSGTYIFTVSLGDLVSEQTRFVLQ